MKNQPPSPHQLEAYRAGFSKACADAGVDPDAVVKAALAPAPPSTPSRTTLQRSRGVTRPRPASMKTWTDEDLMTAREGFKSPSGPETYAQEAGAAARGAIPAWWSQMTDPEARGEMNLFNRFVNPAYGGITGEGIAHAWPAVRGLARGLVGGQTMPSTPAAPFTGTPGAAPYVSPFAKPVSTIEKAKTVTVDPRPPVADPGTNTFGASDHSKRRQPAPGEPAALAQRLRNLPVADLGTNQVTV